MNQEPHIRTRRNVKKKKSKNVIIFLVFLIFFLVVFLIGIFIGSTPDILSKYSLKQTNSFVEESIPSDNENLATTNEVDSVKTEEEKIAEAEVEKMSELKDEFIETFSTLYPSVKLSFLIKNLDTNAMVVHNDCKMNSASLIKLFILETVYNKVTEGEYILSEERDNNLSIMITRSDNKAANAFIDDFGGQNENRKVEDTNEINKFIKSKGYKYTELNRKMYDVTPPGGPTGYQNYTSVGDVCTFLEGIYKKTALQEPFNTSTLSLLKKQERRGKIPAKIVEKYSDVLVANKTGELAQVENDAAIIMGDDFNLIFVVMTDDIPKKSDGNTDYALKERVQNTIADFGVHLVELYKQKKF